MRLKFLNCLFAFTFLFKSVSLLACNCRTEKVDFNYFKSASIVVVGKLINVKQENKYVEYEFEVIKNYKGHNGNEIIVRSPKSAGECGAYFTVGQIWLLDCYKNSGGIWTTNCRFNVASYFPFFAMDTAYFSNYHKKNYYLKFQYNDQRIEGQIKNGKAEGLWKYYEKGFTNNVDENFQLSESGYYINGKREGTWHEFDQKNDTAGYHYYKNGRPYGTWNYYGENGKLFTRMDFKKPNYYEKIEYVSDSIRMVFCYKNNREVCIRIQDTSGLHTYKEAFFYFLRNKIRYTEYYKNGALKEKGNFTQNHQYYCGTWYYYDINGVLQKTKKWDKKLYNEEDDNMAGALYDHKLYVY